MNHKKFRRLYLEERLQVRRRGGRKWALAVRAPMTIPQGPNQRWSLDFVSDAFACGRRFRIFAVVDDYSREWVRLIADTSTSGARVGRKLDAAAFERMARLHTIVSENRKSGGSGRSASRNLCPSTNSRRASPCAVPTPPSTSEPAEPLACGCG